MIFLGLTPAQKNAEITRYCKAHDIDKVFFLSPEKFRFPVTVEHEYVEWADIIMYRHYYRLIQEIGPNTLVVVNECLRTQNRHELTYNCIRNFMNQTTHQLIFQYLPLIDTFDDFMILFDFDTRSRWKRERWRPGFRDEARIHVQEVLIEFNPIYVPASPKLQAAYAKEKRDRIDNIGQRDPHTIPRNLYLLSGRARRPHVDPAKYYIGRNQRFRLDNLQTYRQDEFLHHYTVFEFPHDFIQFADFVALSGQSRFDVLVADLKVDYWYLERYQAWSERIRDGYSAIHG